MVIQGIPERWQLIWTSRPRSACGTDDIDIAITCPCYGFAYGEAGDLSLRRMRGGREVERMDLRPLFTVPDGVPVDGGAVLARWPVKLGDLSRSLKDDKTLDADVKRRPTQTIMNFAAYDGGSDATQFLLQVAAGPCGHTVSVAIGVTADNPHLHVIKSAAHPERPLMLPPAAWRALAMRQGPQSIVDWPCGDHGSTEESDLVVEASDRGLAVKRRIFDCPPNGRHGNLQSETDE